MIAPLEAQVVRRIFCGKYVDYFFTLDHKTDLCDVTNTFAELVFIIICNMYLISYEILVMIFRDLKENLQKPETSGQGHWMALTIEIYKTSCTHLVECIYQFSYHGLQQFQKNASFYLFPFKNLRDQTCHCHKMGRGQPKVIL